MPVQHLKEMVQHVLEMRHKHVTRRVAVQMVDGVHLESVVLLVEAEYNHVNVHVQHNLEQEQTVLDLRHRSVTIKIVRDPSMEDGARTLNAAQPAAEVRELVSANALYQQVVEMIVLVRPPIIIVIQIHVPSQEQPLHRMITPRETMMSKKYSD